MITFGPPLGVAAVIVATGLLAERALDEAADRSPGERLVTVLALGVGATGVLLLAAGDLGLYSAGWFWGLTAGALVVLVAFRRVLAALVMASVRALRRDVWDVVLPGTGLAMIAAAAVDLSMRAPLGNDERDYKWFTPVQYALHHGIVQVDARLSNGVYLSELLVVPSAVFRSLHAARLTQLIAVVLLGLGVRAVSRRLGGSGYVAAFATMGALVVAAAALPVGSDVLVASLLVASCLLVLRGDDRSLLMGGLVLAAAVTTKQYTVLLMPLFLMVGWWALLGRRGSERGRLVRSAVRVVAPSAVILLIGFAHTWVLVGTPVDRYGLGVFPSGDARVLDGRAAGRIPSAKDLAILPAVPAFVGLASVEPYGRRAGVLLPVALATAITGLLLTDRSRRRGLVAAAAAAAGSFALVAPVFIKTRFLIFTWAAVFVAADVAVAAFRSRIRPGRRAWMDLAVQLVLVAGMADTTRWILDRYWWSPLRG